MGVWINPWTIILTTIILWNCCLTQWLGTILEVNYWKLFHKNVKKGRFWCFKQCILNATRSVPSSWKCTKIIGACHWGSLAGLRGPTSKGRGREERGREGRGGEGLWKFGPSQCWRQIDAPAGESSFKCIFTKNRQIENSLPLKLTML